MGEIWTDKVKLLKPSKEIVREAEGPRKEVVKTRVARG